MTKSTVSIIIRGKDEEDWLGICLRAINSQSYKDFEIIYIDNESSDASVNVAKAHDVKKIKTIKKYLPGLAINMGIEMSHGKYIVILSAHCIPTNTEWLGSMVDSIKNKKVAGSYGRQLPLPFTSPDDARDLLITFGNEDRIQVNEPFFHNANSIIKRSVWEKIKFDSEITNIEDRDWAKKVQNKKFLINYNSSGCVFHIHGLHQHGSNKSFRAQSVNNLINKINDDKNELPEWFDIKNRICPVVLYGKNIDNIEAKIENLINLNPQLLNEDLYYYGDFNPKIKGLSFLKRKVSTKVVFNKFTLDILNILNKKIGFKIEAICFIDLGYKNFIKNSYIQNKEKIFQDNIHFSTFAFVDNGDIWSSSNNKIKPLKEMFDSKTQFLRLAFGQGSIIRCSTIRINKSKASDGFANTFKKIKYLVR